MISVLKKRRDTERESHGRMEAEILGLIPGVGKIPWSRKWQLPPVFSPGKFHGQRSLAVYIHGVTRVL